MPRPQLRAWNWASYSQGPVRLGAFVPSGANFACDLERGARRLICSQLQEIVTQEVFNLHQSRSDLYRQSNRHPALCQRIKVSGRTRRTTTTASRQSNSRERNASDARVAAATRLGLMRRS